MNIKFLYFILLSALLNSCTSGDPDPTANLELTILDDLAEPVSDASVVLYATLEDWQKEENPLLATKTTSSDGKVFFFDLEQKTYYMDIQKDNFNNWKGKKTLDLQAAVFGFLNIQFAIIEKSNIGLLAAADGKKWLVNSVTFNGDEMFSTFEECEKDNLEIFYKDGTYINDKSDLKCSTSEAQQRIGTWIFNSNQTSILVTVDGATSTWILGNLETTAFSIQKNISGLANIFTYEVKQ